MGDIEAWFKSLPVVTRYWFSGTILISILGKFGILNPRWLVLIYELLFYDFHIWRPVTALFFYPITPQTGFHFLINLYFLYSYAVRLETGVFLGRTADFLFMLIFLWICCVIVALFAQIMVLMDPMVLAVLYVWCQLNKDTIVTYWFGTQFQAMYLPWVVLVFNVVVNGGGFMEVIGILVGHLYFFLQFKLPQEFDGPSLLTTPSILYNYLPNQRPGTSGFGAAPTRQRTTNNGAGAASRGIWAGQGHTLGD